jgi:hypothetical protein
MEWLVMRPPRPPWGFGDFPFGYFEADHAAAAFLVDKVKFRPDNGGPLAHGAHTHASASLAFGGQSRAFVGYTENDTRTVFPVLTARREGCPAGPRVFGDVVKSFLGYAVDVEPVLSAYGE